jgi:nucleoid DNA-binding protein
MAEGRMTQLKMIKKIAEETQIVQRYVKEVLKATVSLVRSELLAGRPVKITDLGTFKPATRAARTYAAPLAGKIVKKPAANTVRFKVTADLKRACNE